MSTVVGNLTTAIQSAVSGQKLSQNWASVISQNITNVYTEGYSRKEVMYDAKVLNGVGSGVEITGLRRITDELKVDRLRELTSTLQKLEVLQQSYSDLDGILGKPGANNSLCSALSDFQTKVKQLSLSPEDEGIRNSLLLSAQRLCTDIQTLANDIQTLRQSADMEIYDQIQTVNGYLSHISDLNQEIFYTQGEGDSTAALLDDRDRTLQNIAKYMDIRVQESSNGTVSIFTDSSGQILVQSTANQLTFIPSSGIDASSTYPGTLNGILINNNPAQDITTSISQGSIGGYLAIRDTEFPNIQAVLDELTGVLRDEVNKIHNQGTASVPPQTLTGTRVITGANPVTGSGTVEIAVVDNTTGNLVQQTTLNLATIGTFSNVVNTINTALSPTYATASFTTGGELQIQGTNTNYGIAVASTGTPTAYITDTTTGVNYGFSHYFGLNDFFVTGSTVTGSQPGISSMIQVRNTISNNVGLIANTTLDTSVTTVGQKVVTSGGNQNMQALMLAFEKQLNYSAVGNLPALSGTINSYAAILIQDVSSLAKNYEQNANDENTLWNLSSAALETIRGVDLQQEVMDLMKWQRSQKACLQLYKTANDMLDAIVNIGS